MICSSDYSHKSGINIVYALAAGGGVCVHMYICPEIVETKSLVILFFIFSNTSFPIFNAADIFQDGKYFMMKGVSFSNICTSPKECKKY